jgi:hypothetical protein
MRSGYPMLLHRFNSWGRASTFGSFGRWQIQEKRQEWKRRINAKKSSGAAQLR